MSTGQWNPNVRGLVPRKVSDAIEYLANSFVSMRSQQNDANASFLTPKTVTTTLAAQKQFLVQGANVIGNGTAGNIQAPALGTGEGPSSLIVVGWKQIVDNTGVVYHVPLFK